ncbi:MAG: flagellar filament protein FlaA, partial [Spirochaetia bacterium]|nr:flagellar filament protein FlaA [Spirochaetia bacterium]
MKKGFKVFVNLALLFVLCIPAFSQPHQKSVETFVIDNFDTEKEWTWTVNASRFVAEGYPK